MILRKDKQIAADSTAYTRRPVVLFSLTAFTGAFLLFQVQPLIGKYILPWFGGGPEVWTTCMLFFQLLLLLGYAYAHLSLSFFGPGTQAAVHISLIFAALLTLPVIPASGWKPTNLGSPIFQILFVLALSLGLPYFVLSATAPLVQRWFSGISGGASPYRLYAYSNAGSFLALISYPFVVEPRLTRQIQAQVWSLGLVGFAVLCACCAVWAWRKRTLGDEKRPAAVLPCPDSAAPGVGTYLLWLALPAAAATELLAVTNKISQDVAPIPLLWIVPLSLYLLSFVICFHSEKLYVRPLFIGVFALTIAGVGFVRVYERSLSIQQQILLYCAFLLSCCFVCHGELFRLRPHPRYLSSYYLMIAAGGAAGGIFVAVIAPLIFNTYRELYVGLAACCLFVFLADRSWSVKRGLRRWLWAAVISVVGVAAVFLRPLRTDRYELDLGNYRNFFGVLTVWERDWDEPDLHRYILQHGTTFHGLQFVESTKSLEPTTYYGQTSGVGLAISCFPREHNRRIGVVGLGVGTLAAYGKTGDYIRFYEINPQVKRLAQTRFSYLENCAAGIDIVLGDARLSMEKEPPQEFDLLVLDAFISDVVPIHLLTKEAFEIYLRHLKPDGVLAFHISNVHLDLRPVVWKLAEHFELEPVWIENDDDDTVGVYSSDWVLVTDNHSFLDLPAIYDAASWPDDDMDAALWTDEYVNLLAVLK